MTQRDRIVVGVFGLVAVLAAYWMLALKPARQEAKELETRIEQQETRKATAQQRVANGERAKDEYPKDYTTLARLGKAVPADDQTPSLLFQLESAADRHAIDFRQLELRADAGAAAQAAPAGDAASADQAQAAVAPPGSAIGPAGFPTLPFNFSFQGDFFRMERFLAQIERFTTTHPDPERELRVRGRLLTVDGISIGPGTAGFPQIEATVAATTYVLPPGEAVSPELADQATTPTSGTAPAPGSTDTANAAGDDR